MKPLIVVYMSALQWTLLNQTYVDSEGFDDGVGVGQSFCYIILVIHSL
jgi:hypothetical protein